MHLSHSISSSGHYNVVNFQDHSHNFGGQSQGTSSNQWGLEHVFFLHVHDWTFLHADPCILLTLCVSISEFGDHVDWAHTRIFGKGEWNNF